MGVPVSSFPIASTLEADDFVPIITAAGSPTGTKRVLLPNLLRVGGKVIMVDGTNGIDAQGTRGSALAYLTLAAAQAAAQSGDVIIVLPGTYRAGGLGKTGVNWHFYPGSKVYRTQGDGPTVPSIFDDGSNGANAALTYSISGSGEFHCDDVSLANQGTVLGDEENSINPGVLISVYNSSSDITVQCRGFYSSTLNDVGSAIFMVYVRNCGRVSIVAEEIDTTANAQVGGVLWVDGELHTNFTRVKCHHTSGNGGTYAFWASEPAAGAGGADWYCHAGFIDTHYSAVYFDGVNSTYKMWFECQEMRCVTDSTDGSGVNLAAIECLNAGRLYVSAQKILTKAPATKRCGPVIFQSGGELWVNAQKFTAESVAAQTGSIPLFIQQTGGVSRYTVQQYEHSGSFAGDGVAMSGGTLVLEGGEMSVLNGRGIVHSGGTSRIKQMRIVTSNTNAAGNCCVFVSSSGLTVDGAVMIAPALAFSVDASNAQNVLMTFCFSNRPADVANVTVTGAGVLTDDPSWV